MVTAFPLQKGLTNITSGSYGNIQLIHAVEDSTIDITWDANTDDSATDTINMLAGSDFMVGASYDNTIITVSSGKVHLSR
jgi:hypothetical protein